MPSQSACVFLAIVLTLAGVWLGWRASTYRMEIEEACKDRKLTPCQAKSRMRLVRIGGQWLTLAGLCWLVVSVWWMGN